VLLVQAGSADAGVIFTLSAHGPFCVRHVNVPGPECRHGLAGKHGPADYRNLARFRELAFPRQFLPAQIPSTASSYWRALTLVPLTAALEAFQAGLPG